MQITTITAYALIEANYNKNVCTIFGKKNKDYTRFEEHNTN